MDDGKGGDGDADDDEGEDRAGVLGEPWTWTLGEEQAEEEAGDLK